MSKLCGSPMLPTKSATLNSSRSFSAWRTIRHSGIARGRIWAASTVRQFFITTPIKKVPPRNRIVSHRSSQEVTAHPVFSWIGTGWLVEPDIHKTAETQLGPFAYRSNGAQYFNLLWPVCLGFWWTLHRSASSRQALVRLGAPAVAPLTHFPDSGLVHYRDDQRGVAFTTQCGPASGYNYIRFCHYRKLPCSLKHFII